jgi:hypothetical protein
MGQTGVSPISVDAIEQFQVSVAPYDVNYLVLLVVPLVLLHVQEQTILKDLLISLIVMSLLLENTSFIAGVGRKN